MLPPTEADKAIVRNKSKVTESQIRTFLELCWSKYARAKIEPGMYRCRTPVIGLMHRQVQLWVQLARNPLANRVPR